MRRLLLLISMIGAVCSTQAQEMRRMSKDIAEVAIRSRKLKLENLLDSVIKYAPQSYVEPKRMAVIAQTSLYQPGDTPFNAQIPAYLVKEPDHTYALKRDTTETPTVIDRLSADEHQRILNFTSYPVGTNLLAMLERRAYSSVSQKGFYAVSGWDDSLRYHVIVPRSFKRDLLSKMVTTKMDEDTIMAYSQYTILRRGWVLEESIYKATTADRELVKIFRKAKSYSQADSLMTAARSEQAAQKTYSIKQWEAGDDGRYRFARYQAIDNLMFFSGSLLSKRKDEMRSFTFSYELRADDSRSRKSGEGLQWFQVRDFIPKTDKGASNASGLTVSDTY
ncbi:MAG: hypothetical protein EOP52_01315 [Sphingobacteriales bacterium]|nr:MAG: hypothetical protein EOP52_01315 [Sphingobacteriales bacterium]